MEPEVDHQLPSDKNKNLQRRWFSFGTLIFGLLLTISFDWYSLTHISQNYPLLKPILLAATGIILTLIFSAVGFLFSLNYDLDTFTEQLTNTSRAVERRLDFTSRAMQATLDETSRIMEEKFDSLDRIVDCRDLGPSNECLEQVFRRVSHAQSVRNTFAFFGVPDHDLVPAAYSNNQIAFIKDQIVAFVLKGGVWSDIVSQEMVNSRSFRWLNIIDKLRCPDKGEYQERRSRYSVRHLNDSYPLINFIILHHYEGHDEVLFGWGHHAKDPSGRVFLSRNKEIVGIFSRYWEILQSDSTLISSRVSKPISIGDISGLWFRVAYDVSQDLKASAGVPNGRTTPYDIALVTIEPKPNRELKVEGARFTVDDNFLRRPRFVSTVGALVDQRLWFSTSSVHEEKLHLAGWYRFTRAHEAFREVDSIDEFYGEFLNLQRREETKLLQHDPGTADFDDLKVRKLLVFGVRLTRTWLDVEGDEDDDSIILPDAPPDQADLAYRCWQRWREVNGTRCSRGHEQRKS